MENNYEKEEEINIFEYLKIISRYKKFIIIFVILLTLAVALCSLFLPNIYQSTAVIMPISEESASTQEMALASQFGGLVGLGSQGSDKFIEIQNLLNSTIIREKLLNEYNLYPIIFYKKWDEERKQWKSPGIIDRITYIPGNIKSFIVKKVTSDTTATTKMDTIPTLYDGLKALNEILNVESDIDKNIIKISVMFHSPEQAKNIAEYTISTLKNYMIDEAKKEANAKKNVLDEQLKKTYDPIIQQKLYMLITAQVEAIIMAEAREGFAFKIIDVPRIPEEKIKPKRGFLVVISFFASTFVGVFLVFFFEYYKKIKKQIKLVKEEE